MFWISDKEAFVTSEEFGHDLEHVEVLQKKYDEFAKDLANHEERVLEVNKLGERLIEDEHPDDETVRRRLAEMMEAWERLRMLSNKRQERYEAAAAVHDRTA